MGCKSPRADAFAVVLPGSGVGGEGGCGNLGAMVPALLSLRLSLLLPLPCARFGAQPEGRPGGGGAGLLRRVHAGAGPP